MARERNKSIGEVTGRMDIKAAFDELFRAIDIQEGGDLDVDMAEKLRDRCAHYQETILEAFDKCAKELKQGEYSEEEEEDKILDALDSVMPILKNINKIQAKLNIPD